VRIAPASPALTITGSGNALGVVLLLVVFGAASTGGDAPRINDITTDLENPPKFALEPLSLLSSVRAESSGGRRGFLRMRIERGQDIGVVVGRMTLRLP